MRGRKRRFLALALAGVMLLPNISTAAEEVRTDSSTETEAEGFETAVDGMLPETEGFAADDAVILETEDPAGSEEETAPGYPAGSEEETAPGYPAGSEEETAPENSAASGEETGSAPEEFAAADGGLVISDIEEVDTPDDAAGAEENGQYPEVTDETAVTETVSTCGWATDAQMPAFCLYNASAYQGSFGAQLSGKAKEIYTAMEQAYVKQYSTSNFEVKFSEPIVFETMCTVTVTKDPETGEEKYGLEWEKNEAYMSSVKYPVQAAYDAFVYDHPEVFWTATMSYSISVGYSAKVGTYLGQLKVGQIYIQTRESYAGAFGEIHSFMGAVSAAEAQIRQSMTDSSAVSAAGAALDYLCAKLSYKEGDTEEEKTWAHSAAGVFLKNNQVVCEGYAKAYKILCNRLGIECVLVPGAVRSDAAPHMWNYVCLNGTWYLVDVTWADSPGNRDKYFLAGSAELAGENRIVSTNFSGSEYTQIFTLPVPSEQRYVKEEAPAEHTHTFSFYTYDGNATCTSNGTESACCTFGCGVKDTREAAGTMLPHSWEKISEGKATCTQDAYAVYRCSSCHTQKTEKTQSRTGHAFKTYASNQDADWYRNGTKTAYCANGCGAKNTVTDAGSARIPTASFNASGIVLKKGQSTSALRVTGLAAGDAVVSWKSGNTGIVKVKNKAGRPVLTAQKKTGRTTVTVTLRSGLKKSITVKVQAGTVRTAKLSGLPKKLTVNRGKTARLAPVVSPITSAEKVTYASSNKKVATVSSNGTIKAKASGKARITVRSGSKKATVTVTVPKITTTKLTGVPRSISLKKGKSKTIKPKRYPSGSESAIQYTSSNKKVAFVSSGGKITARKKGTAVITVKSGKAVVKCKVTVK